jgi:hypothetical protein
MAITVIAIIAVTLTDMEYTPHYDYSSRLLLSKVMNKSMLRDLPKFSPIGVLRERLLFDIELLLSFRTKPRAKIIARMATLITRCNE